MLGSLNLPEDIKSLSYDECKVLCREIRKKILYAVNKNGGHLSSNLGSVELTVALHRCFDSPKDKIFFDVGHQSYTHKILTGRLDKMDVLRKKDGISGFPRPDESEHDPFIAGHSSNSVSAAVGAAKAMKLKGDDHHAIAVIGDGALTGGLAYEGLNNVGKNAANLIIILNDNEMSISKNVGAVAKHLSSLRGQKSYINAKNAVARALDNTPVVGQPIKAVMLYSKDTMRYLLYRMTGYAGSSMFENMGIVYLGPVDGHNLAEIEQYLEAAKAIHKPVVIHVKTKKGKGYRPAEENPGAFHALSPGELTGSAPGAVCDNSFGAVMGRELTALAQNDERICAITAAMKYGTGLYSFAAEFPNRFFDVGIAEGHAVTFAAGLASQGMIPVFAVYSSFLQRSYDQIVHDAAIMGTHIVLCVDRAGFTGEDGETHQGVFDIPMLTSIPNTTIFCPADFAELKQCLYSAVYETEGIAVVRYPKGCEEKGISPANDYRHITCGAKDLAVGFGRVGAYLESGAEYKTADVLRLVKLFPIKDEIVKLCKKYKKITIFEESYRTGGYGTKLIAALHSANYKGKTVLVAPDEIPKCASCTEQLSEYGLDRESVLKRAFEL